MHHRFTICCFALLTVLSGCSKSEPLAPQATATPTAKQAEKSVVVAVTASGDPNAAADPASMDEDPIEKTAAADYQPPFPERIHLFLAPKREGKSTAASDQDEAVELLGFVNVRDSHKAVLSINGAVYPVAEGDTQFGVEVISIQPPGVVLQRGRQRWQASLEN